MSIGPILSIIYTVSNEQPFEWILCKILSNVSIVQIGCPLNLLCPLCPMPMYIGPVLDRVQCAHLLSIGLDRFNSFNVPDGHLDLKLYCICKNYCPMSGCPVCTYK